MNRQKLGVYIGMAVFAALLAALYGAIHNQISFTVSPEYFTKFKFPQFGFNDWAYVSPRLGAAAVGVLSTWWMGFFLCLILGLFGFRLATASAMYQAMFRAVILAMIIALTVGLLGLGASFVSVDESAAAVVLSRISPDINEPIRFARAGNMHNASYLGGVLGLLGGIIFLQRARRSR